MLSLGKVVLGQNNWKWGLWYASKNLHFYGEFSHTRRWVRIFQHFTKPYKDRFHGSSFLKLFIESFETFNWTSWNWTRNKKPYMGWNLTRNKKPYRSQKWNIPNKSNTPWEHYFCHCFFLLYTILGGDYMRRVDPLLARQEEICSKWADLLWM